MRQSDQLFGEQAGARVGIPAIDPLQCGPARPLLGDGRLHAGAHGAGGQGHRRNRRDDKAGCALAPSPLEHDLDRAVRRAALLAVGRVVGVEHHGRSQLRAPAPRPRPGSRPRRATRLWPQPSRSSPASRDGPDGLASRLAHPAEGTRTSTDPVTVALADLGQGREHQIEEIGRRRQPDDRRLRSPPRHRPRVGPDPDRAGPARWALLVLVGAPERSLPVTRCRGTRRPAPPSATPPSPPAPARPAGGPQPSHDLRGSTSRPPASDTASSTTHPRTLRPCRGTRTRVPTVTGLCSHALGTA